MSGQVHLGGTAAEEATVTINRPTISGITVEPVTRQGSSFHKKLALDNSSRADVEEIAVVGVKALAGTGGVDIVSSYSGVVWAVQSPERFTYDDDGNMVADALRSYEWDAENRLIAVTVSNVVDGSLARVEFAYDYMSRRSSKTVHNWISNNWSKIENRKFTYDGWNLIKEISTTEDIPTGLPASRVIDYYVWGLDLSGSLQGAGGIGGLIGRVRKDERFFDDRGLLLICHRPPGNPENYQTIRINAYAWPAHEAHGDTLGACAGGSISNSAFIYTFDGNGNVSELLGTVNSELGTVGHYEYSPFGETIVAVGPEAADNPFRFSTKYFVDELGIGDWGRRWYLPPLGRWLNRDPLWEKWDRNLYKAFRNDPQNWIDDDGLRPRPGQPPSRGNPDPPPPPSPPSGGTLPPSRFPPSSISGTGAEAAGSLVAGVAQWAGITTEAEVINEGKRRCESQAPRSAPTSPQEGPVLAACKKCCVIEALRHQVQPPDAGVFFWTYQLVMARVRDMPCSDVQREPSIIPSGYESQDYKYDW